MSLEIGSYLGPYRITGVLGAGGMGVVYRAEDSSLGRDVALKVLPPEVAGDRGRLARFGREARVLAALDHPNIAVIYGWESSTGTPALVLELVEGPTLRDRLAAGALRLDEAIGIARQIADAVEGAHEQGVIHRDLKPANIKIRPDGRVKVLDFGLAKAIDAESGIGAFEGATTTMTQTEAGVAMGTPAYMSPEQARGEPLTRRTDVWSFGVVLFEMIAGRRPFGGGSSTEVVAEILHSPPDWGLLPAATPAPVVRLLRRCLEKDPRARLRDIGDARLELEDSGVNRAAAVDAAGSPRVGAVPRGKSMAMTPAAMGAATVAVLGAIAGAYWLGARRPLAPASLQTRLSITAPPDTRFASAPAISPDGRTITFIAAREGATTQLWIRSLSSFTATLVAGTEDASFPFWSPDSRSIGFFAAGKLKLVNIVGDAEVRAIADAPNGRGGAWLEDDAIVFSPDSYAALKRVPAAGGAVTDFTTADGSRGEESHRFPFALPGRQLLYLVINKDAEQNAMRLVSLDAPGTAIQTYAGIDGAQYADGYLIASRYGQLRAQRIHLPDGAVSGDVIAVGTADTTETSGRYMWSVGSGGILAFMTTVDPISELVWRDRSGRVVSTVGSVGQYSGIELSPKGGLVLTGSPTGELSVMDTTSGAVDQIIKPGGLFPVWSPDGRRVAFMGSSAAASVASMNSVMSVPVGESGSAESLTAAGADWKWPVGWTPDSQILAWIGLHGLIWQGPPGHPERATPYLKEGQSPEGRLSPDGRWIAFTTDPDAAGASHLNIVIQNFPTPGKRYAVSTQGGRFPRWRSDEKEIYFLSGANLMAASVTLGDVPVIGAPHLLFETRLVPQRDVLGLVFRTYQYDVGDSTGNKFLLNQLVREPIRTLNVVTNWSSAKK